MIIVDGLQLYTSQPEVASVLDKLAVQHQRLRELTADIAAPQETAARLPTVTQVRELATLLYDHVRFEERKLFPITEKYLTEAELDAIYKATTDNIKHLDELR